MCRPQSTSFSFCMKKSAAGFIKTRYVKLRKQFPINSNREPTYTATRLALALRRFTQGEQTVQCTVE